MRTAQATTRPRLQNQPSTYRRAKTAPVKSSAPRLRVMPQQAVVARPRRRAAAKKQPVPMPNGLSVMGLLLAASVTVGMMLIVSLGWQRNAYGLAQQEVELRSALDQVSDERQQLMVENRRALNPRETSARSNSTGLADIKLDPRTATTPQRLSQAVNAPKAAGKATNQPVAVKAVVEKGAAKGVAKPVTTKSAPAR